MYIRVYERLGEPPEKQQPDFVRIILIDPAGIIKNNDKLREDYRSKLEDKFNKLDPNWLKQANISFRVEFRLSEPSNEEKARFGKLDFPVYLLGRQHGYKTVRDLMTQHKIPKTIENHDYYDIAKDCWEQKTHEAVGFHQAPDLERLASSKRTRFLMARLATCGEHLSM